MSAGLCAQGCRSVKVLPPMCDSETHTSVQLTRASHLPPTRCSQGDSRTAQGRCIRIPLPYDLRPRCETQDESLNVSFLRR